MIEKGHLVRKISILPRTGSADSSNRDSNSDRTAFFLDFENHLSVS